MKCGSSQARSDFFSSFGSTMAMPLLFQLRLQHRPVPLLVAGQVGDHLVDLLQLFGGREAVIARRRHAGSDLADQAGDADHVEFVEIGCRDRKKPHPLQKRMVDVFGFLQHALVELQPGQLAIVKALRAVSGHWIVLASPAPCVWLLAPILLPLGSRLVNSFSSHCELPGRASTQAPSRSALPFNHKNVKQLFADADRGRHR